MSGGQSAAKPGLVSDRVAILDGNDACLTGDFQLSTPIRSQSFSGRTVTPGFFAADRSLLSSVASDRVLGEY
jgi:hypothetical protein